ncbi:unnamed protein product [Euphydryas editha]|uniref:Uncharacterized protein n=1 Tax=Euphydryas editha TaxID=104508 RepID=A0AAU9UEA2_EUPED|nr:unnamed protein product [Euphydryas editha]
MADVKQLKAKRSNIKCRLTKFKTYLDDFSELENVTALDINKLSGRISDVCDKHLSRQKRVADHVEGYEGQERLRDEPGPLPADVAEVKNLGTNHSNLINFNTCLNHIFPEVIVTNELMIKHLHMCLRC